MISARSSAAEYLKNIQEIRDSARQQIENGAITKDYKLDREQAIGILNEALATELVCVLRYKFHYFMATGIHSAAVAKATMLRSLEELHGYAIHATDGAIGTAHAFF